MVAQSSYGFPSVDAFTIIEGQTTHKERKMQLDHHDAYGQYIVDTAPVHSVGHKDLIVAIGQFGRLDSMIPDALAGSCSH